MKKPILRLQISNLPERGRSSHVGVRRHDGPRPRHQQLHGSIWKDIRRGQLSISCYHTAPFFPPHLTPLFHFSSTWPRLNDVQWVKFRILNPMPWAF